MAITPKTISEVGKATEEVAEHPRAIEEGIETAATKGESLMKNVWGAVKKVVGGTGAAAAGAEADSLLGGSGGSNEDDSESADSIASNPNIDLDALRGTQSGPVLTPSGDTAENIADSITPEQVEDLSGTPFGHGDKAASDSQQLSQIIQLLKSLNASNHSIAAGISRGFSSLSKDNATQRHATNQRRQAEAVEGEGSKGLGNTYLGRMLDRPIATGMKTIAIGTAGAAVLGGVMAVIHHGEKDTEQRDASYGNTEDAVVEAKKAYGDKWADEMVKNAEDHISKMNGGHAKTKADEAENIYLAIKNAFVGAQKQDQDALIDAIARYLKIDPAIVQKSITDADSATSSKGKTAALAINDAVTDSVNETLTTAYKYGTLIAGGFVNDEAWLYSKIGAKDTADKLQKIGNSIVDTGMQQVKDAKQGMEIAKENSTSVQSHLEAENNSNTYRATYAGAYGTLSALGAGKAKAAVALGTLGGGTAFLGQSKENLNNMAGYDDGSNDDDSAVGDDFKPGEGDDLTGKARQKYAIEYLMKKGGWSKAQAAGIVANLVQESYNLKTDVWGDNHEAYGIGQWHAARRKQFKEHFGKDMVGTKLDDQLDFVDWELKNGDYKKTGDALKKTSSADAAARVVTEHYEIPKDIEGQSKVRSALAEDLDKGIDVGNVAGTKTVQAPTVPESNEVASTQGPATPPSVVVQHGGSSVSQQTHVDATTAMPTPYLYNQVVPTAG